MATVELSEVYRVDGLYDVLVDGRWLGGAVLVEEGGEVYWEGYVRDGLDIKHSFAGTFDEVKAQIEAVYQES